MKQLVDVIFCGFGKLGVLCLERLVSEGYRISFILTHKESEKDSVDTYAKEHDIPFSYKDVRKESIDFLEQIGSKKVEFLVSINYKYILPVQLINSTKNSINIHGSLLPKYRGRTPHVWSIINGEKITGVTAHLIEVGVDTGDIIKQIQVEISDEDTGYSLLLKFEKIYPQLLIDSLNNIKSGETLTKQNEQQASYFGKRTSEMGYIDFFKNSQDVINFVRAQASPYPGAYYYLNSGEKIVIQKIEKKPNEQNKQNLNITIGVIVKISDNYFVRCKDALLKIVTYRILKEGGKKIANTN